MKISKIVFLLAFIGGGLSSFAFTPPPPTPWGFHSTLGAITGVIVGPNNCDVQPGSQCQVIVGTGINAQVVDAFADQAGAITQDSNKRLRRPEF